MDKKTKKIIVVLVILLLIFMIITLLPSIRKTYYKIYLKNKISNVRLDDTIIVTSEDNRLDTKTYIKGNKTLTEHYNYDNEEEIDGYTITDYEAKRIKTYNNNDSTVNFPEDNYEISEDVTNNNPTQYLISLLDDWKFKYIEKDENYYILVFGNKHSLYNQYVFLNSDTFLIEKFMFNTDSKYTTVDYNYQFNQNIEESIFENVSNQNLVNE